MPVRPVARTRRASLPTPLLSESSPAPIGGWNARDAVSDMDEGDAIVLDNWFPDVNYVELRRGHASHATGLGDHVETLMAYRSPTASEMFGVAGGELFDVTTSGAVGSAEISSLSNSRFQHANIGTAAGHFLIACNGEDTTRQYNGSAWSAPTLDDGSTSISTSLIQPNVFKNRLFFVPINALKFWYLPVATISGTAKAFALGSYCTKGGYLMAMGTWTRDGGDGLDDLAVFVTSEGEVLLFQGSDPDSAASWGFVGRFEIGKPISRRCMIKVGAELVIVTVDGIAPLSRILSTGRSTQQAFLTDKISGAFQEAARSNGTKFGWQPILYPRGKMVLFNIPLRENVEVHQYVANTTTGAWCRFKGWNANCFEILNDELYFGGNGVVYKADTGRSDNGSNIEGYAKPAFTYLRRRGQQKKINMVRPIFISDGILTPSLNINVDFEDRQPIGAPSFSGGSGAEWDVAEWDVAEWGAGNAVTSDWIGVDGVGYAATINLKVATNAHQVKWPSIDWLFETGGYL